MMQYQSDKSAFMAFLWAELQESFDLEQSWYEIVSNGGGRIDACIELASVAEIADATLTDMTVELNGLPGVFHYEQMYNFAEWLVDHVSYAQSLPSREEIEVTVRDLVSEWVSLSKIVDYKYEVQQHKVQCNG
ncbi:TPA: hypothetical protein NJ211_003813 [Vibrio parahaemolyticus]|uniref:hypothetical protein n=1 Tax=Vibrio alginolyticus TaxID=663 RepID=UPI001BD31C6E|nr:hypothetical protein [Vibrio alginolyticus]ELJ1804441.1 hypothetical protein [Vibrio parahaemolyticus]MBS9810615.1 hypothetical protein [Vibrio alginolyticus]MCF9665114.1 hypothetical protein [Vibrio parahaemolyticus]HCG6701230.1 hypothetical protein [Vibrio parahaemolyticus]HCG9568345.1 hypothetical protein [Vibrio parahaemolyticus]